MNRPLQHHGFRGQVADLHPGSGTPAPEAPLEDPKLQVDLLLERLRDLQSFVRGAAHELVQAA
jgi:hypothetical protein